MYTFVLIDSKCNEVFKTHSVDRMISFVSCASFEHYKNYQYELYYSALHSPRKLLYAQDLAFESDFEHLRKTICNL